MPFLTRKYSFVPKMSKSAMARSVGSILKTRLPIKREFYDLSYESNNKDDFHYFNSYEPKSEGGRYLKFLVASFWDLNG